MSIVVVGPQGCGKSTIAQALADHFGCASIVHEWDGRTTLDEDALALTNTPPARMAGVHVVGMRQARRILGITAPCS